MAIALPLCALTAFLFRSPFRLIVSLSEGDFASFNRHSQRNDGLDLYHRNFCGVLFFLLWVCPCPFGNRFDFDFASSGFIGSDRPCFEDRAILYRKNFRSLFGRFGALFFGGRERRNGCFPAHRKPNDMKKIYIVPNIVTSANMFCGFYSVVASFAWRNPSRSMGDPRCFGFRYARWTYRSFGEGHEPIRSRI